MRDEFFGIVMLLVGVVIGLVWVRNEVTMQCEKIGSFYVGDKTYTCEVKK